MLSHKLIATRHSEFKKENKRIYDFTLYYFIFFKYDRKPKILVNQNRYEQLVSFGISIVSGWRGEGVNMVVLLRVLGCS
jgi:murein L,D-transpeptidase YafK